MLFPCLFARLAPGPHRVDAGSFATARRSGSGVLAVGSRGVSHGLAGAGVSVSFSAKAPAAVRVGTAPRVSAPPDAAPRSGRRAPSVRSGPLRFLPATTRRFPALVQFSSSPVAPLELSLPRARVFRERLPRRLPSAAHPLPLGLSVSVAWAGMVALSLPFGSLAKALSVLLTFFQGPSFWFIDFSVSCFQCWLRSALNPTGAFPEVHLLVADSGSPPSPGSACGWHRAVLPFPDQRQHFRGRPPQPAESPVPGTPVLALI